MKYYLILLSILFASNCGYAQQSNAKKRPNKVDSNDFSHKVIFDSVKFHEKPFNDEADFSGSTFLKYAILSNIKFVKDVHFDDVTFKDRVDFDSTKFKQDGDFSNTTFVKSANFSETIFSNYNIDFGDTKFRDSANFTNAKFLKTAYFLDATFSGYANFTGVTIADSGNFYNTRFKKMLNLSHLNIHEKCDILFINSVLPDTILFSDNYNLKSDIYFTQANFSDSARYDYVTKSPKPVWLYLFGSNIDKLHVDYIHFRLLLPSKPLATLYGTPKTQVSIDEKISVYEALLKNFKSNGQEDSYRLLDIEYQHFKWDSLQTDWIPAYIRGIIPCVPKYWWNFGYNKELIFVWTLIFLLGFTVFTYIHIYSLTIKIYPIEKIHPNKIWQNKLSVKGFGNRLWYSFMYTSTVFFMLSLKMENVQFKEKKGTFYLITMYTTGLICLAYMANFVLQK